MDKPVNGVSYESSCSVNKAARQYGVPRTILQDRITGIVIHGTKSGPKPYQKKVNWLNFLTSQQRLAMVKPENK